MKEKRALSNRIQILMRRATRNRRKDIYVAANVRSKLKFRFNFDKLCDLTWQKVLKKEFEGKTQI